MNYKNYPIVKLLFPYLFGILTAYFFPISEKFTNPLLLFLALFLLLSVIFYRIFGYNKQWVAGLLLQSCFVFFGISSTTHLLTPPDNEELPLLLLEKSMWIVTISDTPVEKSNSVKCVGKIQAIDSKVTLNEQAVFYFRKCEQSATLQYGDLLLINSQLSFIEPPKNPYAFDYKQYMERRGIRLTGFVDSLNFEIIGQRSLHPVKEFASKIQKKLSRQFAIAGLSGDEYSVITAILLGNDETMDPALKMQYSSAGVSHILCVSGMHVGIIFMILDFLLKPLNYGRRTRILKSVILLLSIWGYAQITGLAPSVQRAATMFSFVTIGGLLRRNTNVFHSLFASLFILLVINPLLLFEIGFQLSYAAVFGIVVFQKPIADLWKPKFRIVKYFWELAAVSVSAQLATFPFAVYYFGQFPNYFLIANLSVILLSFIVVVSGVVVLALSFSSMLSIFAGKVLAVEIKMMNGVISFIEQLPGAVTTGINIHFLQLVVLLFMVYFLGLFVLYPRRRIFLRIYALASLLAATSFFIHLERKKEISVTVYALSKNSGINFNWQGESILLNNFMENKGNAIYQYHIKNHELKRKINSHLLDFDQDLSHDEKRFLKQDNFIVFHDRTFLFCRKGDRFYASNLLKKVNYLILCDGCRLKPEFLEGAIAFQQVVIDESITPYYQKIWQEYCLEKGIDCCCIREEGAAVIKY
ncbi:ComEC family competence protein [Bacteroidales bacterium OttesenSCG-928-B11]|nr:ComEC family competence protein [Bacteroidales bacterium OttesenSCG-928-E04]MDL2308794.1 ComEC family competence protein [Bacteroidales bacterium OttesenSCG-928-C03]MDL2311994.1 ComEC family competence protein [Bacteroidales bacterium OttesenSCG-928-B11]